MIEIVNNSAYTFTAKKHQQTSNKTTVYKEELSIISPSIVPISLKGIWLGTKFHKLHLDNIRSASSPTTRAKLPLYSITNC